VSDPKGFVGSVLGHYRLIEQIGACFTARFRQAVHLARVLRGKPTASHFEPETQ